MKSFRALAFRNRLIGWFPWWWEFKEDLKLFKYARKWRSKGWVMPLPALLKRAIIKSEAARFGASVLVETGTYQGDTVWFFRRDFAQIFSIEVQPELARLARQRFAAWPHIRIIEGDSAVSLAQIVPQIQGRCVFWLDGHYSAGLTGRGSSDCPIWGELETIATQMKQPALILIDDAKCFGTEKDYPSIPELVDFLSRRMPDCQLQVSNNIIRVGAE